MSDPKNSPEISENEAEIASEAPEQDNLDTQDVVEMPEPDETPFEDAEGIEEESAEPDAEIIPEPVASDPEPVVETKKNGFMPALLGGVIAAVIGAGGALVLFPQGLQGSNNELVEKLNAQLQAQVSETAQLKTTLSAIVIPADLSDDLSEVARQLTASTAQTAQMQEQVAQLQLDLEALAKRPVTQAVSPEAVAAYEAELKSLQMAMSLQRSEVEAMVAEAEAQRASADITAQKAALRNALTRVESALSTGQSFAGPLADLQAGGAEVPVILLQAADGVPSLAMLNESYPDLARKALSAARSTSTERGVGSFLRDQLGVRSLTPQGGDDPDSILSRAEAALKSGHLSDTLAELEALPEIARVELTDWLQQVDLRLQAQSALAVLSQQVMTN